MDRTRLCLVVLLTAAVSYLLRVIPLMLFRKPFSNPRLAAFLDALPYALLAAMILPEIFYSTGGEPYPAAPEPAALIGGGVALALGFARLPLPVVAFAATAAAYVAGLVLG